MRHAKSSWDDMSLDDFDRPLNDRGRVAAPDMAQRYLALERDWEVDRIVSSMARRAAETAKLFAAETELEITWNKDLYLASPGLLLQTAREFDDDDSAVMLVAHNPGISDCAGRLSGEELGDLPTAFMAAIRFPVEHWSELAFGGGTLVHLDAPKGVAG